MAKGLRKGSITHEIASLATGESFSRTKMLGVATKNLTASMQDVKRRHRNTLTKQIERAEKASPEGAKFRLDTGTWLSADDSTMFVTVAVSRII